MLKQILQGRFLKHPLHPIFVHFPIGLWFTSWIFDFIFQFKAFSYLATVSYFCIIGGLIGALASAATGLAEYQEIPINTIPRRIATIHFVLNIIVTLLFFANFVSRSIQIPFPPVTVNLTQFLLSTVSIVTMSYSGFLGGRLAYYHQVGIRPTFELDEADIKSKPNHAA